VVAAFARHPDAAAVGGPFLPEGESERERVAGRARSSRLGVGGGYGADRDARDHVVRSVQCGAYRRDVLLAAGLFDVAMGWGEDEELNWRLRRFGPIYLCPDLRQVYRPRATLRALARQYWNYGHGRTAVLRKHPDFLLPRHLAPSGLVLATLGLAVAATVSATAAAALTALLGAYGAVVALAAIRQRRAGWRERLLVPAALVCMHWGCGAGMLVAACARARDAMARRLRRPLRPTVVA
jgi:GT2 family glycosyltransferase